MRLRRHIILLVLTATLLPMVVGVLAVFGAAPVEGQREQDQPLVQATARLILWDLTSTSRSFQLGAELFDLASLSKEETVGVLRMLYKQDEDVNVVVLLDENDQAVVDPVYLTNEQIVPGTETATRLPMDQGDLGVFLQHLPIGASRENKRSYSDPYVNKRKNAVLIAGAVEVSAGEEGKSWVLGFERSLRRIHRAIAAGGAGPGLTTFVVDGGGRLVVHPEGARFLDREKMDTHPLVAHILSNGSGNQLRWKDSDGDAFSGAFQKLDFLDWSVVVQRQLLPLSALGWRLPVWAWGAWALVAAIIFFAVYRLELGARRMVNEMQRLRDDAEQRTEELKRIQASVLETGKLSAIGDLGAGVAHEFNNPIGGILGLTQLMLRKKKEDDPDTRFLLRIEEEAKRCKTITDNLLRFSEKQDVDHREPLRIERVVDKAADLLTQKLLSQRIQVERNFAPDLPRVLGNEGQLQRAFLNILLNAETAMPEGGTMTLSAEQDGGKVVVKVKDSGRGVPAENLERVFEPFFTTKDDWKGAGLGLSEVYKIVKEHGGEVWIDSMEGQGTEVCLSLPVENQDVDLPSTSPVPLA
jgi:signal transduction histidine kinase